MPQDDVQSPLPLRGGRQKANHIQVHRIEAGLWERKNLIEPLADSAKAVNEVRKFLFVAAPMVAAGGVYVAYKVGKAAYEWTDGILEDLKGIRNITAPLENQAAFFSGEEDEPVMGLTESVILTVLNLIGIGK